MRRLSDSFSRHPERSEHGGRSPKIAFIPYIMAGDPDLETTEMLLRALANAGANVIELGVPYSDPLADGPSIAAAGLRALAGGTRLGDVLSLVRGVARELPPILVFSYYNPILQYGVDRFACDAAASGAAGTIVPDLSLEEGAPLREAVRRFGMGMPHLVAPSTKPERAAQIAEVSTGFVYAVSRLGVTGTGAAPDFEPLREQIAVLRRVTAKPIAVGFGVSAREHVDAVRALADGVIVGSAIADAYARSKGAEAASRVERLCRTLL